MDYEKKINEILKRNGIKVNIIYIGRSTCNWDKENLHDYYKVTLTRGNKTMTFNYFASIINTEEHKKPSTYDVVSCLEWYEIYDFEDFCLNFGYDTDSIKALNTYLECQKQQKELFEIIPEKAIRDQIIEII